MPASTSRSSVRYALPFGTSIPVDYPLASASSHNHPICYVCRPYVCGPGSCHQRFPGSRLDTACVPVPIRLLQPLVPPKPLPVRLARSFLGARRSPAKARAPHVSQVISVMTRACLGRSRCVPTARDGMAIFRAYMLRSLPLAPEPARSTRLAHRPAARHDTVRADRSVDERAALPSAEAESVCSSAALAEHRSL